MDLAASAPSFGGGVGLWAAGLMLISVLRVFPIVVRLLGLVASILFAVTACRICAGAPITPLSQPLPFFAYPVLVATFVGWIVTLLKNAATMARQSANPEARSHARVADRLFLSGVPCNDWLGECLSHKHRPSLPRTVNLSPANRFEIARMQSILLLQTLWLYLRLSTLSI